MFMESIEIKLIRNGKGNDPDYSITIFGDGKFIYFGNGNVNIKGKVEKEVSKDEIVDLLSVFQNIMLLELLFKKDFQKMKQEIHDYITMSIQLAQDEIEDIYESIGRTISYKNMLSPEEFDTFIQRQEMMKVLSDFYRNNPY